MKNNTTCGTISAKTKVLFLELSLVKLINATKEPNGLVSERNLLTSFTLDKMKLYPFLLSTANGYESRRLIFENIFTDFRAGRNGIIEVDVEEYLKESEEFTFFRKIKYSEKITYFIPVWSHISSEEFILQMVNKLTEDINCEEMFQVSDEFKYPIQLIEREVEHLSKNHDNFLIYNLESLKKLGHEHKSWLQLNILNYTTDFDNTTKNDQMFDVMVNEKSPLEPA